MIDDIRYLRQCALCQLLRSDVVESECEFLICIVFAVVFLCGVGQSFMLNHPPHQFHRRIVLSAIWLALLIYSYLIELMHPVIPQYTVLLRHTHHWYKRKYPQ